MWSTTAQKAAAMYVEMYEDAYFPHSEQLGCFAASRSERAQHSRTGAACSLYKHNAGITMVLAASLALPWLQRETASRDQPSKHIVKRCMAW